MAHLLKPVLHDIVVDRRELANPMLQVVQIKPMNRNDGSTSYRVAISDGVHYVPAIVNSQFGSLIQEGELQLFNIIKVEKYNITQRNQGVTIVILALEVVDQSPSEVIGSPSKLNSNESNANSDHVPQQPQQYHTPPAPRAPVAAPARPAPKRPPASGNFISISSLTAYITSWSILAKVVQKTNKRNWANNKSSGVLFSVTLKDKSGDEIRGTFFNEEAEKFFPEIQVEHVYEITGGRIKMANTKFSPTNNMYEISFDKTTTFKEVESDQSIGELTYSFKQIKEIENIPVNKFVDILAICTKVDDITTTHSKKTNQDLTKRVIQLADDSNYIIECTLWNEEALNFPSDAQDSVITIKDARVGEFHGKQLSTSQDSILKVNPKIPEADGLLAWWSSNRDNISSFTHLSGTGGGDFSSRTRTIFLQQINNGEIGSSHDTYDYFQVYATLHDILLSRNLYYLSCPNPDCKKAVQSIDDSTYDCPNCKQQTHSPVPRYAFTATFGDFSGTGFFSVLGDEIGTTLIGVKPEQWKEETEGIDDKEKRQKIVPKLFTQYKIRCRARTESYNNEDRVKLSILGIQNIDYAQAALFFAKEIEKF